MAMLNGTIKRLTDKGFGFIAASDGNEYFFHSSACNQTRFEELREGQAVTLEHGQGPKGPRAENVRVADKRRRGAVTAGAVCWRETSSMARIPDLSSAA